MAHPSGTHEKPKRTVAMYDDHIGAILDGRYRVLAPMGEGSFKRTYSGEHVNLDSKLVVSFLHEEALLQQEIIDQFLTRAKYQSRIDSPHVVKVLDFGMSEKDEPYIVTEYAPGENLSEYMARKGPLAPSVAATLIRELAEVIDGLERDGISHGNLKPSNIKISEAGASFNFKLMDFGDLTTLPKQLVRTNTWNRWLLSKVGANDLKALSLYAFFLVTGRLPRANERVLPAMELCGEETRWYERLDNLFRIGRQLGSKERAPVSPVLTMLSLTEAPMEAKPSRPKSPSFKGVSLTPPRIIAAGLFVTVIIIALGFLLYPRPSAERSSENKALPIPTQAPKEIPLPTHRRPSVPSYMAPPMKAAAAVNAPAVSPPLRRVEFYIRTTPAGVRLLVSGARNIEGNLYELEGSSSQVTITARKPGYTTQTTTFTPKNRGEVVIELQRAKSSLPMVKLLEEEKSELINPFSKGGRK